MNRSDPLRYVRIGICLIFILLLTFGNFVCDDLTMKTAAPIQSNCTDVAILPDTPDTSMTIYLNATTKTVRGNETEDCDYPNAQISKDAYTNELLECKQISFRNFYTSLRSLKSLEGWSADSMVNAMFCFLILFNMAQILVILAAVIPSIDEEGSTCTWYTTAFLLGLELLSFLGQAAVVYIYCVRLSYLTNMALGDRSTTINGILALYTICHLIYLLDVFIWLLVEDDFTYKLVTSRRYDEYNVLAKERQMGLEQQKLSREREQQNKQLKQTPKKKAGEPQLTRVTMFERGMFSSASESSC